MEVAGIEPQGGAESAEVSVVYSQGAFLPYRLLQRAFSMNVVSLSGPTVCL